MLAEFHPYYKNKESGYRYQVELVLRGGLDYRIDYWGILNFLFTIVKYTKTHLSLKAG